MMPGQKRPSGRRLPDAVRASNARTFFVPAEAAAFDGAWIGGPKSRQDFGTEMSNVERERLWRKRTGMTGRE